MGRRKGSLNKSTIEKMKLEAKLKEEKENSESKATENNFTEDNFTEDNFTEDNFTEDKLMGNTSSQSGGVSTSLIETSKVPPKKNKEKYNICERCGETVYCDPVKIDLNFVLGLSEYHRESKRYVKICMNCAKELNSIVDNWLCEPEKGGNLELRRFPKF